MAELARYEILEEIGANHYAKVFRGYDAHGDREVCVMELLEKYQKNPDRWNAIWQQVLDMARLKHEYAVSVHDFDRERRWIVVELMRGNASQLPRSSTDLVRTTLYRGLQVLEQIHGHGLLHGDVRPANVLFDGDGRVKLSFSPGLYLADQIPRRETGHAFLAPEIYESDRGLIGPPVDLFALGMTSLALLMGDQFAPRLLQGAKDDDLAWQRFHRDFDQPAPSASSLLPDAPADLVRVIDRLIARRCSDRFASAKEALTLLERPVIDATVPTQSLPARPTPAATPQNTMPRAQSKAKTPSRAEPKKVDGGTGGTKRMAAKSPHPKWSREWINEQLGKPVVMGTVVGTIIVAMIAGMMLISAMKTPSNEVAKEEKTKETFDESAQVKREHVATSSVDESSKQADPKTSPWMLPPGLAAIGTDMDAATQLPTRVSCSRLNDLLRADDTPLTFRLFVPGEATVGASPPREGELEQVAARFEQPYYLAEYETTRSQVGASPILTSKYPVDSRNQGELPATGISWNEVEQFLKWLGPEFTLPTEQQWERSARGATGDYPWGADSPRADLCRLAFQPGEGLVPVTEFAAGRSPAGLSHVIGNAAEWCADAYAPGQEEGIDVVGARQFHVIRGGSYRSPRDAPGFRVTWRGNCADAGDPGVGFRIAIRIAPRP